jgi:hypothetical protein
MKAQKLFLVPLLTRTKNASLPQLAARVARFLALQLTL